MYVKKTVGLWVLVWIRVSEFVNCIDLLQKTMICMLITYDHIVGFHVDIKV